MSDKNSSEELQSRREFFKKAAKAALPVVGAVVLANLPISKLSAAIDRLDSCSSFCVISSKGDCSNFCEQICYQGCQNSYSGTYSGGCARQAYA